MCRLLYFCVHIRDINFIPEAGSLSNRRAVRSSSSAFQTILEPAGPLTPNAQPAGPLKFHPDSEQFFRYDLILFDHDMAGKEGREPRIENE